MINISKIQEKVALLNHQNYFDISISLRKNDFEWNLNGDIPQPASSIIKLFILGAIIKAISDNQVAYDNIYVFNKLNYVSGAGIIKYLHKSIEMKIEELIYLMIEFSDNNATNAIIDILGMEYIQNFVTMIGAKNTSIVVPMMPNKNLYSDMFNTTTTNDVLLLFKALRSEAINNNRFEQEYFKIFELIDRKKSNNWNYLKNNFHYLFYVIKKNIVYLPFYLRAVIMNQTATRLTKRISKNRIQIVKSGTGQNTFHDFCIVLNKTNNVTICVMSTWKPSKYLKSFGKRSKFMSRIFGDIGKEVIDNGYAV